MGVGLPWGEVGVEIHLLQIENVSTLNVNYKESEDFSHANHKMVSKIQDLSTCSFIYHFTDYKLHIMLQIVQLVSLIGKKRETLLLLDKINQNLSDILKYIHDLTNLPLVVICYWEYEYL